MTKHTPGPWFLDTSADVDLPDHVGISADKHGLLAQVVWKMEYEEHSPECEANARLIVSAPDLLESLKEYDDAFTEFDPTSKESRTRMRLAVVKARAALSRATGETT